MVNDNLSPCAADALRSVRQVKVNGIMTGFTGLTESIAAVQAEQLTDESAIKASLMNRIRSTNYIPPRAEDLYAAALMEEYRRAMLMTGPKNGEATGR